MGFEGFVVCWVNGNVVEEDHVEELLEVVGVVSCTPGTSSATRRITSSMWAGSAPIRYWMRERVTQVSNMTVTSDRSATRR